MRTKRFMYFCIEKYVGTQGVCRQLQSYCGTPLTFLLTFIAQKLQSGQCPHDHVARLYSLIRIYDLIMGL